MERCKVGSLALIWPCKESGHGLAPWQGKGVWPSRGGGEERGGKGMALVPMSQSRCGGQKHGPAPQRKGGTAQLWPAIWESGFGNLAGGGRGGHINGHCFPAIKLPTQGEPQRLDCKALQATYGPWAKGWIALIPLRNKVTVVSKSRTYQGTLTLFRNRHIYHKKFYRISIL